MQIYACDMKAKLSESGSINQVARKGLWLRDECFIYSHCQVRSLAYVSLE